MKPIGSRSWKLKGKFRVLTFLLFLFSVLFITYQLISYVTITNYQAEEAHALQALKEKHKTERIEYSLGSLKPVGWNHDPENLDKYFRKPVVLPILGAPPSSWKFYVKPGVSLSDDTAGSYFMCIHSGHQIAWEKVNDDYCDCPDDGSDEPSTNACLNGTFYCTRTSAKYPEHVPSSRVNDHVCDCCDGSDEILANCKKHC